MLYSLPTVVNREDGTMIAQSVSQSVSQSVFFLAEKYISQYRGMAAAFGRHVFFVFTHNAPQPPLTSRGGVIPSPWVRGRPGGVTS